MIARRAIPEFLLLVACLSCGSCGEPVRLNSGRENAKDALEIIQAAIESHGGESNFAKASIGKAAMTIEGTLQPGLSGHFTKIDIFHLPGKLKRVVGGEVQGQKLDMNVVINGDTSWIQRNGGEPESIPVINPNQGVYPNDSLDLLLAIKRADFHIRVVPADDLNGRPVHRIRMERDGEWVGDLFFDRETHLCAASKKELVDSTIGRTRTIETYYSNYKMVDGLNLPMLIETVMDGETAMKVVVTEVKFMNEINDAVFAKPVVQK